MIVTVPLLAVMVPLLLLIPWLVTLVPAIVMLLLFDNTLALICTPLEELLLIPLMVIELLAYNAALTVTPTLVVTKVVQPLRLLLR